MEALSARHRPPRRFHWRELRSAWRDARLRAGSRPLGSGIDDGGRALCRRVGAGAAADLPRVGLLRR